MNLAWELLGRISLDDTEVKRGLDGSRTAAKRAMGDIERTTDRAVTTMDRRLQDLGRSMQNVGRALSTSITAPIVAMGAAALASAGRLGTYADSILDLAEQTGLSTDNLQAFENVARAAGVEASVLGSAAESLTRRLSATGDESARFQDTVERLGVATRTSTGELRGMDDLLPDLLRALGDVENVTERNTLATELFKGSASDIIPVVALGADEIDRLTREAHEMGQVLSTDALTAANDFRIEQEQLRAELGLAWREISVSLIPVMTSLARAVRDDVVPRVRAFTDTIAGVVNAFQEMDDWQQRAIGGVVTALALAGPFMMAGARLIKFAVDARAALIALRTAMLAFVGPGAIVAVLATALGVTLVNALRGSREEVQLTERQAQAFAGTLAAADDAASLTSAVEAVAAQMDSRGRQAFRDYADEVLRTADSVGDARDDILRYVAEMTVAHEVAALRIERARLAETIETATDLRDPQARLADYEAQLESLYQQQRDLRADVANQVEGAQAEYQRLGREIDDLIEDQTRFQRLLNEADAAALAEGFDDGLSRTQERIASIDAQIEALIDNAARGLDIPVRVATRAPTAPSAAPAAAAAPGEAPTPATAVGEPWRGPTAFEGPPMLGPAPEPPGFMAALLAERAAAEQARTDAINRETLITLAGGAVAEAQYATLEEAREARAAAEAGLSVESFRLLQSLEEQTALRADIMAAEQAQRDRAREQADRTRQWARRFEDAREAEEAAALAAAEAQERMTRERLAAQQGIVTVEKDYSSMLSLEGVEVLLSLREQTRVRREVMDAEQAQRDRTREYNERLAAWTERLAPPPPAEEPPVFGPPTGPVPQVVQTVTALEEVTGALQEFGFKVIEQVPILGTLVNTLRQGGDVFYNLISEMLFSSEPFRDLMQRLTETLQPLINSVMEPLVGAFNALLDALVPAVELVFALVDIALKPLVWILEQVVAPVFRFVATLIANIWNAVASALNVLPFVNLKLIKLPGVGGGDSGAGDASGGLIGRLEERRRTLQDRLRDATSELEIARINRQLAEVNEELARLRGIGVPGAPSAARDDGAAVPTTPLERMEFSQVRQSVQFAVSTPLVEASVRMLDAANIMNRVLAPMDAASSAGFGALPPFTSAIDRMTPVLERLLRDGVSINVGAPSGASPRWAFLR